MNMQAEKIELAKMLLETDDTTLISQIRDLFKSRSKDFWEELPDYVKQGVKNSRDQALEGQLIPFEQVLKELKGL